VVIDVERGAQVQVRRVPLAPGQEGFRVPEVAEKVGGRQRRGWRKGRDVGL
jgi:hypothetical protein